MINSNGSFSCDTKEIGKCIECNGTNWHCEKDCKCKCLTSDGWKTKI